MCAAWCGAFSFGVLIGCDVCGESLRCAFRFWNLVLVYRWCLLCVCFMLLLFCESREVLWNLVDVLRIVFMVAYVTSDVVVCVCSSLSITLTVRHVQLIFTFIRTTRT